MTELQLYKFIQEYDIYLRWDNNNLIAWIPFYCLEDFVEMLGSGFLSDGGIDVNLQEECIALSLNNICDYFDINIENIFEK